MKTEETKLAQEQNQKILQKKRGRYSAAFLTPTQLKNYVKAAQETHDAHAIEALCNAFRPLILKEAHKPNVYTALGEDAENTAWEIFLEFIYKYKGNKFSLLPGLVAKTLHYRLLDTLHKEGGLEDCDALDGNEALNNTLQDPHDYIAEQENRLLLKESLKKLSITQQNIITEIYFEDFTLKQCSRTTKIPLNTCNTNHRRALRKLRKLLS